MKILFVFSILFCMNSIMSQTSNLFATSSIVSKKSSLDFLAYHKSIPLKKLESSLSEKRYNYLKNQNQILKNELFSINDFNKLKLSIELVTELKESNVNLEFYFNENIIDEEDLNFQMQIANEIALNTFLKLNVMEVLNTDYFEFSNSLINEILNSDELLNNYIINQNFDLKQIFYKQTFKLLNDLLNEKKFNSAFKSNLNNNSIYISTSNEALFLDNYPTNEGKTFLTMINSFLRNNANTKLTVEYLEKQNLDILKQLLPKFNCNKKISLSENEILFIISLED